MDHLTDEAETEETTTHQTEDRDHDHKTDTTTDTPEADLHEDISDDCVQIKLVNIHNSM